MNKILTTERACHVTDIRKLTLIEYCGGPNRRGPAKCSKCGKPFKKGEAWRRLTSPTDPELGAYSIGIHTSCASVSRKMAA